MPIQRKTMEVKIDKDLLNRFLTHCQEYNLDQDDLIHHLMYLYLKKGSQKVTSLKDGYIKMRDINLSLCQEFEQAEAEAEAHNIKQLD